MQIKHKITDWRSYSRVYLDVNDSSVLEGKSPQFFQQLISGVTALDAHCYQDKHLDINWEILLAISTHLHYYSPCDWQC